MTVSSLFSVGFCFKIFTYLDDADFTGAKERIALSKKGRKEEEKKRKKGIVELIEEA